MLSRTAQIRSIRMGRSILALRLGHFPSDGGRCGCRLFLAFPEIGGMILGECLSPQLRGEVERYSRMMSPGSGFLDQALRICAHVDPRRAVEAAAMLPAGTDEVETVWRYVRIFCMLGPAARAK